MTVAEMRRIAKEIRNRLLNPPNAVEDIGIDLKRKPEPKPPKVLPELKANKVKEYQIAYCRVNIITSIPSEKELKPLKLMTIIHYVADSFGTTVHEIIGKSRTKCVVIPRHTVCYLAFKHSGMSLTAIGRRLERDHTTIINAIEVIEKRMDNSPVLASMVSEIEQRLLSLPYDPRTHYPRPSMASQPQRDMEVRQEAGLSQSQIRPVGESGGTHRQELPPSNDNNL